MEKDLFSDLAPAEGFEPTPEFITEILDRAWSDLRRYRICREHPQRTDGEYALSSAMLEMAVHRVFEAKQELQRMTNPRDKLISELQAKIRETEADAAKARAAEKKTADKVAGLKEELEAYKARAANFEQLSSELQTANLDRPEVSEIVTRALILLTGLRYVQYVADPHDINRQLVCGMMLQCQKIFQECGAATEVALNDQDRMRILTEYYATLPARDIAGLRAWGSFHEALPERRTA